MFIGITPLPLATGEGSPGAWGRGTGDRGFGAVAPAGDNVVLGGCPPTGSGRRRSQSVQPRGTLEVAGTIFELLHRIPDSDVSVVKRGALQNEEGVCSCWMMGGELARFGRKPPRLGENHTERDALRTGFLLYNPA